MSAIENGIRAKFLANSAIAALVGTRVHPLEVPQGTAFPVLIYARLDGAKVQSLSGTNPVGQARYIFDCWSDVSYDQAKTLARTVNAAFNGFRGAVTGGSIKSASALDDGEDISEPSLKLYGVRLEYSVWYKED